MKKQVIHAAIISFPGSNRERDATLALEKAGFKVKIISSCQTHNLKNYSLIMLPGGFSYGDYLRCGAMAARLPIMTSIYEATEKGVFVIGVCNGFQILTESGLLPGTLTMNVKQNFICRQIPLSINTDSAFSCSYKDCLEISIPIAHHEGNYFADEETLAELEYNNRIIFRYRHDANPNGSLKDIAGIVNARGNVLGMMPHPENACLNHHYNCDGLGIFTSIAHSIVNS